MLGEVPFRQYYGTVDATPLFVMLAGPYGERTGDWALVAELWPAIERALAWLDGPRRHGRRRSHRVRARRQDRPFQPGLEGLPRLRSSTPTAASPRARSRWSRCRATPTRRGLPHRFARARSDLEDRVGRAGARRPRRMRQVFEERFWCDSMGFYASRWTAARRRAACARAIRVTPCGRASSAPSAAPRRLEAARQRFLLRLGRPHRRQGRGALQPDVLPQRLDLAARQRPARARPGPRRRQEGHRRHLRGADARDLLLDQRRIPELYCGFRRRPGRGPTLYPAACSPQAWAAAAPFSLHPVDARARVPARAQRGAPQQPVRAADRAGRSRCAMSRSAVPAPISPCARALAAWRWRCCARRATCTSRWSWTFRAAARLSSCRRGSSGLDAPKLRADLATARPSREYI